MSRIQGVQDKEAGLVTRLIFRMAKRRLGKVPLGLRVRAIDPKLLRMALRMDVHTRDARTVPSGLKELAQLKVAAMVGCPF